MSCMPESDCFFYLSSDFSKKSFGSNSTNFFVNNLKKSYVLKGEWECCLYEAQFNSNFSVNTDQCIYLCCDLVKNSFVADSYKPVLRRIDIQDISSGQRLTLKYLPYYVDVINTNFNEIAISLLDKNLKPCTLTTPLLCLLHFRKKTRRLKNECQ